jgi:hypothetical protein
VTFFSVLIQTRADGAGDLNRTALNAFADAAEPYQATVRGGTRSWSARIRVEASGAADGAALGAALVTLLAKQAGLPAWPVVRAEAVREDVLDEDVLTEDLARPRLPELVSGPEAAEILGVSVQRVHQLAVEHSDFRAGLQASRGQPVAALRDRRLRGAVGPQARAAPQGPRGRLIRGAGARDRAARRTMVRP